MGLPVAGVSWTRVLDDTSEATVSLAGLGRSPACFAAFREAAAWQHEVAIVRDDAVVWQGPLTGRSANASAATWTARDLSVWLDRRVLPVDRSYVQVDVATIFSDLVADAMSVDDSPNVTVSVEPTGVLATRRYLAGQHLLAGPELRELAKAGIDWTVVGRSVIAGGTTVPVSPIVLLQDTHLSAPPSVSTDGLAATNRYGIAGAGGGEGADPIYAEASDAASIATYGLLQDVTREDRVRDVTSAQAAADSRLVLVADPVVKLDAVRLAAAAPVLLSQLVPGALVGCAFASSAIEVSGVYRLHTVAVTAAGGNESVTLTLEPVGST